MLSKIQIILRKIFSFLYTNEINTKDVLKDVSNIVKVKEEKVTKERDEILKDVDLSLYQDEVYINEYKEGRPNLLILDDLPSTEILYSIDFRNIQEEHNFDITEKFNVIMIHGRKAGFAGLKFLTKNIKIDYAILDITIDSLEKFDNGDYIDLDGVDIAIELHKLNNNVRLLFSSAHTMDIRNSLMLEYITKYENYFKKSIIENSLDKNSIRYNRLFKFLGTYYANR